MEKNLRFFHSSVIIFSIGGFAMSEKLVTNKTSVNKAISNVDLKYRQNKIKFALQVNQLNTGRVSSEQEMEDRIQKLFDLCQQTR
jgi:hypothetical protein